jgi:hypothetical protein
MVNDPRRGFALQEQIVTNHGPCDNADQAMISSAIFERTNKSEDDDVS